MCYGSGCRYENSRGECTAKAGAECPYEDNDTFTGWDKSDELYENWREREAESWGEDAEEQDDGNEEDN